MVKVVGSVGSVGSVGRPWGDVMAGRQESDMVAPVCKASNIAVRSSSDSVRSSRLTYFDIKRSVVCTTPPAELVAVSTISYQPSPTVKVMVVVVSERETKCGYV